MPTKIDDQAKKRVITEFLRWMLKDGQKLAEALGYAPLPKSVVEKELKAIGAVK